MGKDDRVLLLPLLLVVFAALLLVYVVFIHPWLNDAAILFRLYHEYEWYSSPIEFIGYLWERLF